MNYNVILGCSIWFGVLTVATFAIYGIDKRRAKKDGDRISEKTLHIFSLLGGWLGAIIGQKLFRHKTVKRRFRIVFWLTVVGNLVISGLLFAAFTQIATWMNRVISGGNY